MSICIQITLAQGVRLDNTQPKAIICGADNGDFEDPKVFNAIAALFDCDENGNIKKEYEELPQSILHWITSTLHETRNHTDPWTYTIPNLCIIKPWKPKDVKVFYVATNN